MAKQYKGTAFTTQILSNAKESHIDNVMVFGLFLFYEIFMPQIQYNPIFECNWTGKTKHHVLASHQPRNPWSLSTRFLTLLSIVVFVDHNAI